MFTSSLYANGSLGPEPIEEDDHENPSTLYGASKLFSELDLKISSKKYGFSYAIARLFFIYGPKQFAIGGYKSVIVKNFQRFLEGQPMQINGSGNQILDYVYVEDCIKSLIGLSQSKFQGTVNVSSGVGVSVNELIIKMSEICGNNRIEHVEADWTEGTKRIGNNSLLAEVSGYKPNTPLIEGLGKTWESIKNGKA